MKVNEVKVPRESGVHNQYEEHLSRRKWSAISNVDDCIRESLRIDKFVKVGVPGDTDKSK